MNESGLLALVQKLESACSGLLLAVEEQRKGNQRNLHANTGRTFDEHWFAAEDAVAEARTALRAPQSKAVRVSDRELALPDGGKMSIPPGWILLWWETTKDTIGMSLMKKDVAYDMASKIFAQVKREEDLKNQPTEAQLAKWQSRAEIRHNTQ